MTAEDLEGEHPDVTAERHHRGGFDPGATAEGIGVIDVRPLGATLVLQCTRCPWSRTITGGSGLISLVRLAEDHVDRAHSGALPPGWASRQASQPDPHMIREK